MKERRIGEAKAAQLSQNETAGVTNSAELMGFSKALQIVALQLSRQYAVNPENRDTVSQREQ